MIDLERFRGGDGRYFEEVMRDHGRLVLFVAAAFAQDADHAEDLFQEIWKRTYERRASFQGRGSFRAWLHRLASNVCIGDYRARQSEARAMKNMRHRMDVEGIPGPPNDPLTELERREFHQKLHRAMGHLSDREHEAVSLRILEGRAPEEVAGIMDIDKATVRSHIRNAVKRMLEIMEDPGYELPRYQSSH